MNFETDVEESNSSSALCTIQNSNYTEMTTFLNFVDNKNAERYYVDISNNAREMNRNRKLNCQKRQLSKKILLLPYPLKRRGDVKVELKNINTDFSEKILDLGKQVKVIKPYKQGYYIEIIVGVLGIAMFFIPFVKDFFANSTRWRIPAHIMIPAISALAIIHGVYKLIKKGSFSSFEVYENGIQIAEFSSSFEDLTIRIKSTHYEISNANETITYKAPLRNADKKYINSIYKGKI